MVVFYFRAPLPIYRGSGFGCFQKHLLEPDDFFLGTTSGPKNSSNATHILSYNYNHPPIPLHGEMIQFDQKQIDCVETTAW